jgi:HEAT repeat protein
LVDTRYLLSDEQMKEFIVNGFVKLKTTLPAEVHQRIYERTEEVFATDGNPGNNILPRVPELNKVFADPVIVGALSSVLGPDYAMHTHRHPHINRGPNEGGGWHKDSYWGFRKVRCHRTRWAMIFYYPQDTPLENGPTGVMPGTHCFEKRAASEAEEVHFPVTGEAGSCALVHFDLWHRAMPNQIERMRYMMKFQFTRMSEPVAPTWNCQDKTWSGADGDIMSAKLWDWHCGGGVLQPAKGRALSELQTELKDEDAAVRLRAVNELGYMGANAEDAIDDLAFLLRDEKEPVRTNAAYALGAIGSRAVPILAEALGDEAEETRLVAAHGLAQAGAVAAPTLLTALQSNEEPARGFAAFALGDMGAQAGDSAVAAVAALADDPSEWVRRNVTEALGRMSSGDADAAVSALCQLLKDEDGQTRYEAAYALARLGEKAAAAVPVLAEALYDTDNRYVSGHSVTALQRIGTAEAQMALFDYLSASRWCSMTTKESTF